MAEEGKKGLKARIKTEIGYMKKGAKVLPKVVAKKGKTWLKNQVEASRARRAEQEEIDMIAKEAEAMAYRKEKFIQAKKRGQRKAREEFAGKPTKKGSGGGIAEMLGFEEFAGFGKQAKQPVRQNELSNMGNIDIGSAILGDYGKKKKKGS